MNQIVLDVLESLRIRLLADDRIEDAVAAQLVEMLTADEVPNCEAVVEMVRRTVSGAEQ